MTRFSAATVLVAVFSGATASVVEFGIGSLLTPLLSLRYDTRLVVAAGRIPQALATGLRCRRLRAHIDRPVLIRFGLLSASGALAGAMPFRPLAPANLTRVLGALLTALARLMVVSLAAARSTRRRSGILLWFLRRCGRKQGRASGRGADRLPPAGPNSSSMRAMVVRVSSLAHDKVYRLCLEVSGQVAA